MDWACWPNDFTVCPTHLVMETGMHGDRTRQIIPPRRFFAPSHSPLPKSATLCHRIFHCVAEATDYQHGNYDSEHNHHHHEHNHDHLNHYCNDGAELSGTKRVVVKFAKAIGLMNLANFLREHLLLCRFVFRCCCLPLLADKARCKARKKRFHSCCFSSSWEIFTSRSKVDVEELKENYPDSALVLNVNGDKVPNIPNLSYQSVPVHNIKAKVTGEGNLL